MHSVQADRVCGSWLQIYGGKKKGTTKPQLRPIKLQIHHVQKTETDGPLTCESINGHICWNDSAHSGV